MEYNESRFQYNDEESLTRGVQTALRSFVNQLPVLPPKEIVIELERLGYKGQEEPRRAVALMAYRHIRRLKRLFVDEEDPRNLPPKNQASACRL